MASVSIGSDGTINSFSVYDTPEGGRTWSRPRTEEQKTAADVDKDSKVTLNDAKQVLKYSLGIILFALFGLQKCFAQNKVCLAFLIF